MGLPRRADITDRGRRWVPKGGKFGMITYTYDSAGPHTPGIGFEAGTPTAVWTLKDADGGVTTTTNNNPTFSFNTANGGAAECELQGVVTSISASGEAISDMKIKGGNKWSDLTTLRLNSTNLTSFTCYEWNSIDEIWLQYIGSSLTTIKFAPSSSVQDIFINGNSSLGNFETYEWPNLVTFNGRDADEVTTINGAWDWPELVEFEFPYCNKLQTVHTGNWPKVRDIDLGFSTGNLTTFNTKDTWVDLEFLNVSDGGLSGTFQTYNTWTKLERLEIWRNYGITDFTVHTTWSNFNYLDCRNEPLTNNCIDNFLIACDTIGTSNGRIDYRLTANGADANRSASANAAIANLTTNKGWDVLR